MATGTVVKAYKDATNAYAFVRVPEGGAAGDVEYNASTPLVDAQGNAKSATQLRTDVLAAISAQRNAQIGAAPVALPSISGSVTV